MKKRVPLGVESSLKANARKEMYEVKGLARWATRSDEAIVGRAGRTGAPKSLLGGRPGMIKGRRLGRHVDPRPSCS